MSHVILVSGFLGAGKTTLIKKLIREAFQGKKMMLIENEFGETGVDSLFLQDTGIKMRELYSGCICCSLAGDFEEALRTAEKLYSPELILIEPSGVAKLSDVISAVQKAHGTKASLALSMSVVDAECCREYLENFGEFYGDQIEHADALVLSHTDEIEEETLRDAVRLLREQNPSAALITTPWSEISGAELFAAAKEGNCPILEPCPVCWHMHEEAHEHECRCDCHHEHGEHCHHDHAAGEVFESWGSETVHRYRKSEIEKILASLKSGVFGTVLRAKGAVAGEQGEWLNFDLASGRIEVRGGTPAAIGKICVIGTGLQKDRIAELFHAV